MTARYTQRLGSAKAGDKGRPDSDFYQTPAECTRALLSVETFWGAIWEPACGAGAISEVLKAHPYRVYSTDLYTGYDFSYVPGVDFLNSQTREVVEEAQVEGSGLSIVTNPPFRLALEFAQAGLDVVRQTGGKLALFMRMRFLESGKRRAFLAENMPHRVYAFATRVPMMHRPGYEGPKLKQGIDFYGWFVWDGHRDSMRNLVLPESASFLALAHSELRLLYLDGEK